MGKFLRSRKRALIRAWGSNKRGLRRDLRSTGRVTRSVRKWRRNPRKYDLKGFDTAKRYSYRKRRSGRYSMRRIKRSSRSRSRSRRRGKKPGPKKGSRKRIGASMPPGGRLGLMLNRAANPGTKVIDPRSLLNPGYFT